MSLKDEDDFSIDRFNLELESERNSSLMRKYGKKYAIMKGVVSDEQRKLNYIETECAEVIRANAIAYGIDRKDGKSPTDKVVFGLVQKDPEYIKQFRRLLKYTRLLEDYKNAVDTCRQRGMNIRVLAELWLNNYYSKPVIRTGNQLKHNLKRIPEDEDDRYLNDY